VLRGYLTTCLSKLNKGHKRGARKFRSALTGVRRGCTVGNFGWTLVEDIFCFVSGGLFRR
jgi:hypothetical protein